MNDEELEEFYRSGKARVEKKQLQRQSSKMSTNSVGSCASTHSESSSGDTSANRYSVSRQSSTVETQEMGIQTTIGKTSELARAHRDQKTGAAAKERKLSTKDKMKKLFRRKSSSAPTEIEIRIEEEPQLPTLPQGFVVKYMGKRETKGMWGSKYTRAVIEDVVDAISKMPKNEDLPLVNLDVYYQGLDMRPHSKNKIKSFKPVRIPIQFISYGIQDIVFPRIFCFIMVKEMSSQKKSMECHVYVCDTSKNAKQISSCLAVAFEAYTRHLKGGTAKFAVDVQMNHDDSADKVSLEV